MIKRFAPYAVLHRMQLLRALCFTALCINLWAADPFVGSWKLNLAKSTFAPGTAPRSLIMTWTAGGNGVTVKSDGFRTNGAAIRESYVAIYDGKEHAKPGPWNFDAVINRQNSENEREDIFKRGGSVVGSSKLVVSPGGKTLTITWNFGELQDVRVFDRE